MNCRVYRCRRQAELYLYLREGFSPDALPDTLRQRTGDLTEVMQLRLDRRLARVDVTQVRAALVSEGYYLQLPPGGQLQGHLHVGD